MSVNQALGCLVAIIGHMSMLGVTGETTQAKPACLCVQGAGRNDALGAVLHAGQESEADIPVHAGHLQKRLHQGARV